MSKDTLHAVQQIVKIDNTELAADVAGYIREIVVDDRLQDLVHVV